MNALFLSARCVNIFFFSGKQLAFKIVQFLTINVVWWVFFFFIKKIEQSWSKQSNTSYFKIQLYYIYTCIFGTLGCTVFIQETFLFIQSHIYTPGLINAMHILHVKKSHSDCFQSLIKIHPNRLLCCLLLVSVRMQFKTLLSISLH